MKTFDEAAKAVLVDWKKESKNMEHHKSLMDSMISNENIMHTVNNLELEGLLRMVNGKSFRSELATALEVGIMIGIEMEKQEL